MEALCGTPVRLTTLDGRQLTVPVPEVVSPQFEKVVAGEGMPITKQPGQKGNLRIKFHIAFPRVLSDQQRGALQQLLPRQ